MVSPVYASTIYVEGYTSGYYEGYYTQQEFLNYCPMCGEYGTLDTYVKGVNEITCLYCDADYSYSGKEKHEDGPRAYLIPYTPTLEDNTKEELVVVEKSLMEQMRDIYLNNNII